MPEPQVLLPLDVDPARLTLPGSAAVTRMSGRTMGTHWTLQIGGLEDAASVEQLVQAELDKAVQEMSQWEPGSEISIFNSADAGSWHALSPGFFHAVHAGLAMASLSDGAFDPTLGAVVDLWGFGPIAAAEIPPSPEALARARALSGWQRLSLDRKGQRILQPGGLRIDLSGIGKGQAVDRVAFALETAGHTSFLFEIGGEFAGRGLQADGYPWWIDIEVPPGVDVQPVRVGLLDLAVATSGDYRRFHDMAGKRLGHSIDPRTGCPFVDAPPSVTVLHQQCMIADAMATAISVLGGEEGLALADRVDVAAMVLCPHEGGWHYRLSARALAMAEA